MHITIIAIGKLKEKYLRDGINEYLKRLQSYAKVEIIELADEKEPYNASAAEEEQIKIKEGERIKAKIKPDSYLIALAIEGKQFTSPALAQKIDSLASSGNSHLTFIIGGSLGLSDEILKSADLLLSFSALTFPHQLMRLILLEQIYRSFRIIKGEPYHK